MSYKTASVKTCAFIPLVFGSISVPTENPGNTAATRILWQLCFVVHLGDGQDGQIVWWKPGGDGQFGAHSQVTVLDDSPHWLALAKVNPNENTYSRRIILTHFQNGCKWGGAGETTVNTKNHFHLGWSNSDSSWMIRVSLSHQNETTRTVWLQQRPMIAVEVPRDTLQRDFKQMSEWPISHWYWHCCYI